MTAKQSDKEIAERERGQKMNKLLSETDSCLWREGREPKEQVLPMLPEARAQTVLLFNPILDEKLWCQEQPENSEWSTLRAPSTASTVSA